MAISLLALGFALHTHPAAAQIPAVQVRPDNNLYAATPYPALASMPPPLAPFELPSSGPMAAPPPMSATALQGGKVQQKMPEELEYPSLKEIPGLEVLVRRESEAQMFQRWQQKAMKTGEKLVFPAEPVLAKEPYPGRFWTRIPVKQVEPNFVVHGRLYCEQPNLERGLWDLGIVTPVASVGKFFWDMATLPYQCGTRPCQKYDTSAGKCLPGDPSPFYLYPPELSLTGLAAEGAFLAGGYFIFP